MAEPMSDERLAELTKYVVSSGLSVSGQRELLVEVVRLRAQQGTPRVHYGVRYPDANNVMTAPSEAIARAWAKEYGVLVPIGPPARVQRRTVTRHATDWEDVDA